MTTTEDVNMLDTIKEHDRLLCVCSGHMDAAACAEFEKPLLEQVEKLRLPVVFDLAEVEDVTSAFLRVIIRVGLAVGRAHVSVIHPRAQVHKVFAVSGLDSLIGSS